MTKTTARAPAKASAKKTAETVKPWTLTEYKGAYEKMASDFAEVSADLAEARRDCERLRETKDEVINARYREIGELKTKLAEAERRASQAEQDKSRAWVETRNLEQEAARLRGYILGATGKEAPEPTSPKGWEVRLAG